MTGPRITSVVFDLGGVLLDWDPRHLYRQLFEDPGEMADFLARICTPDWHLAHDLGADTAQSCRELALAHPEYAPMIMAWYERGEEMIAGQFEETVRVLAELKASGVRCLALSNMEPDRFAIRRERFGFMTWFDGCVISGIEGVAKPDRRIFQILIDRYALDPAATVFVDDIARNVEAARELGLVGLQFSSASQCRMDLRELGVALPPAGRKPVAAE